MWLDKMSNLSQSAKRDINDINLELVNKLKSNDNAFALGKYCNVHVHVHVHVL
jgi:hypothetical protein